MPTYKFEKPESGEKVDIDCKYEELEGIENDLTSQGWLRVFSMNIISGKSTGLSKMDDGFNDILKDIAKKSGKGNTIQTK